MVKHCAGRISESQHIPHNRYKMQYRLVNASVCNAPGLTVKPTVLIVPAVAIRGVRVKLNKWEGCMILIAYWLDCGDFAFYCEVDYDFVLFLLDKWEG
jgi:hypothetical protein